MEVFTEINWPVPDNVFAFSTTKKSNIPQTPTQPVWLNQVHGNRVINANPDSIEEQADASYTNLPGIVCVVKTADCLPILICNKDGTEVAAVHAGWRSLSAGIIDNTMRKFQVAPTECLVWMGPAIGPKKFEVDFDVLEDFVANGWDLEQGFARLGDKWLVDIYKLAAVNLQRLGVLSHNIYGGTWCTYIDENNFYSHRRSKDKGRMHHLIWLE